MTLLRMAPHAVSPTKLHAVFFFQQDSGTRLADALQDCHGGFEVPDVKHWNAKLYVAC